MRALAWIVGGAAALGFGVIVLSGQAAAKPAPTIGNSGERWEVRFVKRVGDRTFWDVFSNGRRVLRYSQTGDSRLARRYIDSPPGTPPALLAKAKADFLPAPSSTTRAAPPPELGPVPAGKVRVERGRYMANVEVSFPLSLLVSSDKLRDGLVEKGFQDVEVSDRKPSDWPLGTADYYVRARWPGPPTLLDRPGPLKAYRRV